MRCYRLAFRDQGNGEGGGTGTGEPPKTVPVEALQAERKARQDAEARLAALDAAAKKAEEERAAKAGEFEKLYGTTKADLDAKAAKLDALEKAESKRLEKVTERNAAKIKALPEAARKALAPIAAAMAPEDLSDWMEEHLGALVVDATTRPAGTIAGGGRKSDEAIPAACSAEWKAYGETLGISERDWYEKNWLKRHPKKP